MDQAQIMATSTQIFTPANRAIIEAIKKELLMQGHRLTGALEASLQPQETSSGGVISLTAEALSYIQDLETGLAPNQIDHSPAAIAAMTRYVELRMGYKGKAAGKVALRILKVQSREGNPTNNSYQYSKTGFRTEAVKDAFDNPSTHYTDLLDSAAIGSLDNNFHQIKSGVL